MEPIKTMERTRNTTAAGQSFSDGVIEAVWKKGKTVSPDPMFKRDACGALMMRISYGGQGEYGWEIDHIKPVSQGGTDDLENLQPLHWENNRRKGEMYPDWECRKPS